MKKILIILVVIILGAIAYYTLSPLFNTIEVDDAAPVAMQDKGAVEGEGALVESGAATSGSETPATAGEGSGSGTSVTTPPPAQAPAKALVRGPFAVQSTLGHPAEGNVTVIEAASGTVIRYEDFETINGPNLHVYLAKDKDAKDFIDLGPIRGTKGNINYDVPDGVNIDDYPFVLYWCVPFSVLFNYAVVQ